MALLALGINHTTADVSVRERVAFAPEQMGRALELIKRQNPLTEISILSTCNRTELYACVESDVDLQEAGQSLLRWLEHFHQLPADSLNSCHYLHYGPDAAGHMMAVSAGLDSLVLGEPQILGQMKSAYAVAQESGSVGAGLHNAFQQVFAIAKRIRSETAIGENPVSVAYAAVSLAQQIFSDLSEDTALLVGAGETIELVLRYLKDQNIGRVLVANRTLERAEALAQQYGAEPILLSDIPGNLARADIVISSTASQLPILGKGAVESALKARKHKPMFMVDIAVPRDIEAEVGELEDVYLYTVDDLHEVISENKKSRQQAADKAKTIVDEGIDQFLREQRALDSVASIRSYRQRAEQLRDAELAKAVKQLAAGTDPEQALNQLARNLTNKLLHSPTALLKQASADGRSDAAHLARTLLDIHSENK